MHKVFSSLKGFILFNFIPLCRQGKIYEEGEGNTVYYEEKNPFGGGDFYTASGDGIGCSISGDDNGSGGSNYNSYQYERLMLMEDQD